MKKAYNQKIFFPYMAPNGESWCRIRFEGNETTLSLESEEFRLQYKSIYRKVNRKMIPKSVLEQSMEELRLDAYENQLEYELSSRIFSDDNATYYNLNDGKGSVICMEKGSVEKCKVDTPIFRSDKGIREQVRPNLKAKPSILPKLLSKYFHLPNDDIKLLSAALVAALAGKKIAHPMIIITGSKGSGKSMAAHMVQEIIDPQSAELSTLPKSLDDLAIRLYSNYTVVMDNLSSIRKDASDLLAIAVTGGTYTKRALYKDKEEVCLPLRNLIIVTGIEIATHEADILDRALIFTLERLQPEEIKLESELREEFKEDLPKILGACLKAYALAENDEEEVCVPKTRMADSFELMVKAGRCFGYTDEQMCVLLWENQSKVNQKSVEDNMVAVCLIRFMESREYFCDSVTALLGKLREVAEQNHIDKGFLPAKPNVLSRKLNEVKSNLEQEYGIFYEIRNSGACRKITIQHIES